MYWSNYNFLDWYRILKKNLIKNILHDQNLNLLLDVVVFFFSSLLLLYNVINDNGLQI